MQSTAQNRDKLLGAQAEPERIITGTQIPTYDALDLTNGLWFLSQRVNDSNIEVLKKHSEQAPLPLIYSQKKCIVSDKILELVGNKKFTSGKTINELTNSSGCTARIEIARFSEEGSEPKVVPRVYVSQHNSRSPQNYTTHVLDITETLSFHDFVSALHIGGQHNLHSLCNAVLQEIDPASEDLTRSTSRTSERDIRSTNSAFPGFEA